MLSEKLNWFTNFPSSVWRQKLLRTSEQTCASRVQLSWCFAGGQWSLSGWPFGRHQPVCFLHAKRVNNYAKRHPASMPHTWRMCLRIHYDGKHFILKKKISPFCYVLNIRYFFYMDSKRYLIIWLQVENRGQKSGIGHFSTVSCVWMFEI